MPDRLLLRHFLLQFIEPDFSPDIDRHQVLALTAAGLITVPLFVTVFMSVKYLMRPLQAPGWTEVTALGDQMTFCAASMLVSAIVAALEWDTLALNRQDAMILGVLPVARRRVVRAKMLSLALFSSAFVAALSALPAVLHPPLMVANLPLSPVMLIPLMAAHALSTSLAGAFGFACVVAMREFLYLFVGRRGFERVSGIVRSGLLFLFLVLFLLVPVRVSGRGESLLDSGRQTAWERPIGWFVATHAAIAGRVLEQIPRPDFPAWRAAEEDRLRSQYRGELPKLTATALKSTGALALLLACTWSMYLWNARRLHVLPEDSSGSAVFRLSTVADLLAKAITRRPGSRTGASFFFRTIFGSPTHRFYITVAAATGVALMIVMAPAHAHGAAAAVRTLYLAAQTLMITAIVAGLRAAIRTAADERATWVFHVTDTGNLAGFRQGVQRGTLALVILAILVALPVHAYAWSAIVAFLHALNGIAIGWLLVELACASVEQPLIVTIPPNDSLNTVGAVFLGALVISVFVLAHIEQAALTRASTSLVFAGAVSVAAVCMRYLGSSAL
jgi:hypothetical protein